MSDSPANLLVAACGNLMASDDAFGPLVAGELRGRELPGVEVVDLDIRPTALLDHLADRTGLILVDAVYVPNMQPGRVLDLDWFGTATPELVNDDTMSTHGLSLAMQLDMAGQLGMLPPFVRLIGLSIDRTPRVGLNAGPGLAESVAIAANLVRTYAEDRSATIREPRHA
jgi:hydrogenase maturation protease